MRKLLSTWGILILMLVLIVGTVGAQTGDDPSTTPTVETTSQPAESTTYLHPIVQILSAYFGRTNRTMMPTPTPTEASTGEQPEAPIDVPTGAQPETPVEVTPEPVMGPEEFAEEIAMYHEEGMGFGVLVKLYAMAEASVEECYKEVTKVTPTSDQSTGEEVIPTPLSCEPFTVEQLVSEFQGGSGMGQLFKTYGKPGMLGVGHVKKALQNQPEVATTPAPVLNTTPEPAVGSADLQIQNQKSNNGNGNSKSTRPLKIKTPKGSGSNK